VIATTSFLSDVASDVRAAVESGANVITSAEECAFPWAVDAELADELDELARRHGVTILGAGLNPGFAFDALVAVLSGAVWDVASIRVERVVDLSGFSETILRRLGIGFTSGEFEAGVAEHAIHGHIGFPQSMRTVARKLGVELETIDRRIEPVFGDRTHRARDFETAVGHSAGFRQFYTGVVDGRPWFECVFTGHLEPSAIDVAPLDLIRIEGSTPVQLKIEPGLNPQLGSSAVIANSVRRVVEAAPGWLTVVDLPPAVPA
jgi:4-hydroxy-tetrahydrodipicolinate reductase